MKFELKVSGYSYFNEDTVNLYKELGFEFGEPEFRGDRNYWYIKGDKTPEIEISTLDELLKLQSKVKCELIILDGGSIEIYDNYRE